MAINGVYNWADDEPAGRVPSQVPPRPTQPPQPAQQAPFGHGGNGGGGRGTRAASAAGAPPTTFRSRSCCRPRSGGITL